MLPARVDGLDGAADLVARMARLDRSSDGEPTATVPVPGGSVEIRAGDLVDREAEARKAAAERERVEQEIARAEAKLANEGFVAKAPPDSCRPSATSSSVCVASSPGCSAVNYPEAERYLLSLELFGMRFGLDRMRRLMTALGSPQERFGSVHVAGTNGK